MPTWIESHTTIGQHPKTRRLARALDTTVPAAVGHLHLLWHWALTYAPDGDLSRWDVEEVAVAAMWDGDAIQFFNGLKSARFIDPDNRLHGWEEYAGRLMERRQRDAERLRRWRQNKNGTQSVPTESTDETRFIPVSSAFRTGDRTLPYPTVPNQDNPSGYADAPPSLPDFSVDEPPETPTPAASVAKRPKGKDSAPTDTPRPPNPVYAILEAYCAGANLDPKTLPGPVKNRYLGQFKALNDAGYSGDQARRCMAYLRTDPYWSARLDSPSTLIDRIAHWHGKGEPETFQPPAANRAGPATPRPPEIEDGETYYRRILATGQPNGDDPRE